MIVMVIVLLSCSLIGSVGSGVCAGALLSGGGVVSGAELAGAYVSVGAGLDVTTGAVFAGACVCVGAALAGTAVSAGAEFSGVGASGGSVLSDVGGSAGAVLSGPGISDGAAVSGAGVCVAEEERISLAAGASAPQAVSSRASTKVKMYTRFIISAFLAKFVDQVVQTVQLGLTGVQLVQQRCTMGGQHP